jgi:hypothetical protein
MKRICNHSAVLGLVLVLLLLAGSVRAQTNNTANPGLTFDPISPNIGTVGNVTYGYEIDVPQSFAIAALDIFDPGPGGLVESHTVAIWNSAGTPLLRRPFRLARRASWSINSSIPQSRP